MPSEPEEGVVYGHLFTFSPPTRVSQFSQKLTIDNRPEPMPSPLNYPVYKKRTKITILSFFTQNSKFCSFFGRIEKTILFAFEIVWPLTKHLESFFLHSIEVNFVRGFDCLFLTNKNSVEQANPWYKAFFWWIFNPLFNDIFHIEEKCFNVQG